MYMNFQGELLWRIQRHKWNWCYWCNAERDKETRANCHCSINASVCRRGVASSTESKCSWNAERYNVSEHYLLIPFQGDYVFITIQPIGVEKGNSSSTWCSNATNNYLYTTGHVLKMTFKGTTIDEMAEADALMQEYGRTPTDERVRYSRLLETIVMFRVQCLSCWT